MATEIPSGSSVAVHVCRALGLDPGLVRRLVLDFDVNEPVKAYAELIGDMRMLDIQWTFEGINVEFSGETTLEDRIVASMQERSTE